MRLHPPISSASVGGIRQFLVQIYIMDSTNKGYWVEVWVRTMSIGIIYKSKFRMGDMILSIVFVISNEVYLGTI